MIEIATGGNYKANEEENQITIDKTREQKNFMRKILVDKIRCKKCGDIIESLRKKGLHV